MAATKQRRAASNVISDEMARDKAALALTAIQKHEAVCEQIGRETQGKLKDLKEDVQEAHHKIDGVADQIDAMAWRIVGSSGAIILLLLTVCGFLVTKSVTFH